MSVAIENNLPGVTAIINQGQVARPLDRQPTSTAFLVGYSVWGAATTPVTITSWSEFIRKFGGFNANSYLADAVYVFFNYFGGRQAVISRVVGGAAAKASKSLLDRAGTPVATLKVEAKFASSAVDIKVAVAAGTLVNTVKLTFTSVYLNITEIYDNVDLTAGSLQTVNDKSKLVVLSNLASATAAPNNLPAITAATALTGGGDDFAGVAASDYVAGLNAFADGNLGTGQVAVPGQSNPTVYAALKAHAEAFQRLAIYNSAFGDDVSEMLAIDTTVYRSAYAAMYYPWVQMTDLSGANAKRFYPPSIFAVGACAKVDREVGTHKAPANISVPNALDVERNSSGAAQLDENARAALNAKQINVIAPIAGEGLKIYGARLFYPAGETRVRFVHERRVLNLIYYTAKLGLSYAVFAVVEGSGRLFRDLRSSASGFLRNLWRDGALYGATEKEAFLVKCDTENNPPEDLELGTVHLQLAVKLSPTAEQVIVNIDNVPLSQNLNVINGGN